MNFFVLIYLLAIAPKLLWDRLIKGKRHPAFLQRLGRGIPQTDRPVIWIHAVSVGEVKAAQPLFQTLRSREPAAFFLITTTTATGQAEAKRSLPEADAFAYLPIDLSWVVHRWVKRLQPKMFILVESDFWWNLLKALKKQGAYIALVSGKISARSARRFLRIRPFAKRLFSHFDAICVQNKEQYDRFFPLITDRSRLHITGNLKLDIAPQKTTPLFDLPQPVITISCTHAPEEELLLEALKDGPWFIILAPRHPERFEEVAYLLQKKRIPFSRWAQGKSTGRVLLVDQMGQLPNCYAGSRLAIVGGSYVDHVGGHNVLEPALYGTPVFFGPHTEGQKELASLAINSGAGLRVPLDQLKCRVSAFFNDPPGEQAMRRGASQLLETNRGAAVRTILNFP